VRSLPGKKTQPKSLYAALNWFKLDITGLVLDGWLVGQPVYKTRRDQAERPTKTSQPAFPPFLDY